jgi:hypothetical protein
MSIDFTPFGFTPTESAAYTALLDRGPSSGYAVAKELSVARANAYQALNGLVAKGAATAAGSTPQVFRAVGPETVLARIAALEAGKLDRLERQVGELAASGATAIVPFEGERQLQELVLRTAARESGPVSFLGPGRLVAALLPIWRKREADGTDTVLWVVGEPPARLPLPVAGSIEPDPLRQHFGAEVVLLLTPEAALLGRIEDGGLTGYWTSESLLRGVVSASLAALTAQAS